MSPVLKSIVSEPTGTARTREATRRTNYRLREHAREQDDRAACGHQLGETCAGSRPPKALTLGTNEGRCCHSCTPPKMLARQQTTGGLAPPVVCRR